MCTSNKDCNLCKMGYYRAEIKDANGVSNVVCVKNFCGFYGEGQGCSGKVDIEGCDQSQTELLNRQLVQSCLRCSPGYYKYYELMGDSSFLRAVCKPQIGQREVLIYVDAFDQKFSDKRDDQAKLWATSQGNRQEYPGDLPSNPFVSIQQVFATLSGRNSDLASPYNEALIKIYLFKGTHHYIYCINPDEIQLPEEVYCDPFIIKLCSNSWDIANLTCENGQETSQQMYFSELNYHFDNRPNTEDNWKLHIKAADCDFINNELASLKDDELAAYKDKCVDVANGEKPQIRISNPWTYFNITNQVLFENIEFTGEDLFASATYASDTTKYDFMDQWNLLSIIPFKKCTIHNDPDGLDTLSELRIETLEYVPYKDFRFECLNPFKRQDNKPPFNVDKRCFTPEYNVSPNSEYCSGEPYDQDFFAYNEVNQYFTKRHKTLFNLYSFDSMRTKNIKAPQLKIVNCNFKYFVNSLNSLIQVETNNLGFLGERGYEEDIDDRILTYYGEDRGAEIDIQNSTFSSNSFCKSLIYYSRFETLTFDEAPTLLNFTANNKNQKERYFKDQDETSYIRITDSKFKNIGFQQVIQALSLRQREFEFSDEEFVNTIPFAHSMQQGLVLDTNGFQGVIKVQNSRFIRNIAYIQQILISEHSTSDTFFNAQDPQMYATFSGKDAWKHVQFKVCVDEIWDSRYFFQEVINPDKFFDDSVLINALETVAPFNIRGNQGAIIFVDNTFSENIGTTGGAIHIEDPDFRYSQNNTAKNPFIIFKGNKFLHNMAYWAGNAFHIQMSIRMSQGYVSGASDAWQVCGAGILIQDNFFSNNIGLKRHNGGAGVIRCMHTLVDSYSSLDFRSGKIRNLHTVVPQEGPPVQYLDDPETHQTIYQDLFDEDTLYTLKTYGTQIVNNTFSNNYSGKRGTALLIEQISHLELIGNSFMRNGPVHAYSEMENSPYYRLFLDDKRTLSFYHLNYLQGTCIDEQAWMNRCNRVGSAIDMPQVQGALHIINCHDSKLCWFVKEDATQIKQLSSFEQYKTWFQPWSRTMIIKNYFYDNHANIIMQKTQTQHQASSLYFVGGINTTISDNVFTGHRNWAEPFMRAFAYDIHSFYPPQYFRYSQAALIRLNYPFGVYPEIIVELANSFGGKIAMSTKITNNEFYDNLNIQVITYKELEYKASLLDFACGISQARLFIQDNIVTRTQFLGPRSAFIYINGGIASVYDNKFSYSGYLTKKVYENKLATYKRQFEHSLFPWEDYKDNQSQQFGIFWFNFETIEMPINNSHDLRRNSFEHIYCQRGCAYYVTGDQIQQFTFVENRYFAMVGSTGAAVFYGDVNLPQSNELAQVWIQVYEKENFEKIYGGSIQLQGNNVPLTIIGNTNFTNNFGDQGAAVSLNRGGGVYIFDTQFKLDTPVKLGLSQMDSYDDPQNKVDQIISIAMLDIYSSYSERLQQSYLFDSELFDEIKTMQNMRGQVYLMESEQSKIVSIIDKPLDDNPKSEQDSRKPRCP